MTDSEYAKKADVIALNKFIQRNDRLSVLERRAKELEGDGAENPPVMTVNQLIAAAWANLAIDRPNLKYQDVARAILGLADAK